MTNSLTKRQVAKIKSLSKKGLLDREVGSALGLATATVWRYRRAAGLPSARPESGIVQIKKYMDEHKIAVAREIQEKFPHLKLSSIGSMLSKLAKEGHFKSLQFSMSTRASRKYNVSTLFGVKLMNRCVYWCDDEKLIEFFLKLNPPSSSPIKRKMLTRFFREKLDKNLYDRLWRLYASEEQLRKLEQEPRFYKFC